MSVTYDTKKLSHEGALKGLMAGVEKATAMGVPQVLAIVDECGVLLAQLRMTGSRVPSLDVSIKKAKTGAALKRASGKMEMEQAMKLAFATDGVLVNLLAGLPIIIDGVCVGGVGVSSGTGEQDLEVAQAMLAAMGADANPA